MSNQILRKLAVFCLTSAVLSVGAAMTASSANARSIYRWVMDGQFNTYWYNPPSPSNLYTDTFDYGLVIDAANYEADNAANLFLSSKPFYIGMTYFSVSDPMYPNLGFTSHTDMSFSEIGTGTNKFFTEWNADTDNYFFSPLSGISSMRLEIDRIDSNKFELMLYGYTPNKDIKLFASDSNVSFTQQTSVPEPSTILGLVGLAALTFKGLKKNPSCSG